MPTINDVMEVAELLKNYSVVVIEEQCVAVRNRNASCHKCADVCIANAITVSKNEIKIDALSCVSCGACIAACPTAAIVGLEPMDEDMATEVMAAMNQAHGVACIACARMAARQVGDPDKYVTVPCLARMSESFLVALAAYGAQDIVLVDGTCETCKYGAVSLDLDITLDGTCALLEACENETVITRTSEFPSEIKVKDVQKAIGASRRDFFTQTRGYAKTVAMSAAEKAIAEALHQEKEKKLFSLQDRLSAGKSGKMPTFEPVRNMRILNNMYEMCKGEPAPTHLDTRLFGNIEIDAETCSSCGMCVMFCPTDALKFSEYDEPANEANRYLEFQAADCTQCGLCADVCLRNSVTISGHVNMAELFDFEPRLIEIPKPKQPKNLWARRGL